jgi:hypothetical protein
MGGGTAKCAAHLFVSQPFFKLAVLLRMDTVIMIKIRLIMKSGVAISTNIVYLRYTNLGFGNTMEVAEFPAC